MAQPTTTSVKLEKRVKARLHRLAKVRRRSAHWLMREAIEQYVAREEARERLHRDAAAAWDAYLANGRHVTGEAADAWLARLEDGGAATAPKSRA